MHVRGWIKDVMYGLIIFGICAALILVVSVAADNIVAKHNAVIVSKNVNSNLDCDDSICTSVDNVSGSETMKMLIWHVMEENSITIIITLKIKR